MKDFSELPASKMSIGKRSLVWGVGINDALYAVYNKVNGVRTHCPYYYTWKAMLQRCYSKACHKTQPTYIGCSVHPDWHLFSTFKTWMQQQDWKGNQLDKDILCFGNKEYSAATCCFVSKSINSLFTHTLKTKGNFIKGVSWNKRDKVFQAIAKIGGKSINLGSFSTELLASNAYITYKIEYMRKVATSFTGATKIKLALFSMITNLEKSYA